MGHDDEKCETCRIKYKYCNCFFEYINSKDDLLEEKCLCLNKNLQLKYDKKLNGQFLDTYNFSNHDNNKFNLLSQKNVYPYECMDD